MSIFFIVPTLISPDNFRFCDLSMNNPFDYVPDGACDAAFELLMQKIELLKNSDREADAAFCRELEEGVMLGVLIAADEDGVRHQLYAFSGQLCGGFHHEGFVGPVFDYLSSDGYFKAREAEISQQNIEIAQYEAGVLAEALRAYNEAKFRVEAELAEFKAAITRSKAGRDARRRAGNVDETEMAAMIRQSQFDKAELCRLRQRTDADLEPFAARLADAQSRCDAMKQRRRADSEALQHWLFSNFRLLNANGLSRSLSDIFADTPTRVPPSGAGECCAPKLLQAAYMRGWHPIAIAEYWYGRPKGGNMRIHGRHYPSCRGRCLPILSWMLQGLEVEPPLGAESLRPISAEPEIIFENRWFCVVNKPAGMLSVPGKGTLLSVEQWLKNKYGLDRQIKMAHRLDQDTSGLLVATFGDEAYKAIQSMFATRRVKKTYVAVLVGDYVSKGIARRGRIELPLSPDWLDRPRQRVDFEGGKDAVTEYEFVGMCDGRSRVKFSPLTGRTHQLRVHAASVSGLNMPIVGDRLYGNSSTDGAVRLCLHAHKLEFTFALDGCRYSFEAPVPF